ncbi:MAG: acyl-CoA thioesterase [Ruminococcus sp.]|nr:acyl-CoA thioesterase [Ruminococcus sp.]MBR6394632.1 acyl-CoA thioesterase [Ruminococcus sp.]
MRKSTFSLTVRGYELDGFGHVNNSVYLQYGETAIWNFFQKSDLLKYLEEAGVFPVISESSQRYLHELKLLDEVQIDSEFTCSDYLVTYKHKVKNKNTNVISCVIKGKFGFVDKKERIIRDVPAAIKEYIESDPDDNK